MPSERSDTGKKRTGVQVWAAWLIAGLLLLAFIPALSRFAATSEQWLPYPYPRAGSEGLILYESLLMKHGGDIYAPITPERFISGPYPPIYYWLAAWLLPESLPDFSSPSTVSSIFTPGRTLSLIAALVVAALVPLLVIFDGRYPFGGPYPFESYYHRRRTLWLAATGGLVGSLTFVTLPQTVVWATRFRGDILMLSFTVAGLVCVAAGGQKALGRRKKAEDGSHLRVSSVLSAQYAVLFLGALFFALAFYTKQTAIAGPLAAAAYLLVRDWRLGLKWCGVMLAAVGVPFIFLEIATGHWFYLKMIDYHSLPLRASTLTRLLEFAFWEDSWPLILVAVGYAACRFGAWARDIRQETRSDGANSELELVPSFLAASLLTLPTGAVIGADHNHLLMSGLAIAAAVGAACAYALTRLHHRPPTTDHKSLATRGSLLAIGGLVLTYALVTSPPSSWYNADLVMPGAAVQEQYRLIVQNVRNNPGALFFADDPGILALAGKETPYDDPFTMTALAQIGRWDESAYRQMLRERRFALLILECNIIEAPDACRYDTISPGVADSIREGYNVLFRDVLFTYAPR